MQHPFELAIADLQAIDFEIEDLSYGEASQVVGGAGNIPITADGDGPNEVGGPFTPPMGGGLTADGIGPNEVGGPFTPPIGRPLTRAIGEQGGGGVTTLAVGEEGGGWATTLAVGEEGGGFGCFPPKPPRKHRR
jgi:hypothetical protein